MDQIGDGGLETVDRCVFRQDADHEWPLTAQNSAHLRETLTKAGHLLPLPSEPPLLSRRLRSPKVPSVRFLILSSAVIKCARVKQLKIGTPSTNLNNRIALYTGNTYFLGPDLKFSGILRPFSDYAEQISIVVLYRFDPTIPGRIADVQVVAH